MFLSPCLPEFGVHTDLCETGYRVDLVQVDPIRALLDKEVNPGHAARIDGLERFHGEAADLVRQVIGEIGGDAEAGLPFDVLVPVIIELTKRDDLSGE
jgi:hypothetical protein